MKEAKVKSKKAKVYFVFFISLCLCASVANFPAQSGGNFAITQSVIAPGGRTSNGGSFAVDGTIGQTVAGTNSSGEQFAVSGGFWTRTFAPTAASVSISGRILTPSGVGLRNAVVYLTTQQGEVLTTRTSTFGYYRFDEIAVGQIIIITILSKHYQFATQVINVTEEMNDLNFVANGEI